VGSKRKSSPPIYRVACPRCRTLFLLLTPPEDEPVACPRCGERFHPEEEELLDPEDA